MAPRTLLAIVSAFAFLAALPLGAWSDEARAECASSAADGLHAGCCAQGERLDCGAVCPAMQAAVGEGACRLLPPLGSSALKHPAALLVFFTAPPDTAPPKPLYA
jgi:hypothetical protein